jgi:hypothetical protein
MMTRHSLPALSLPMAARARRKRGKYPGIAETRLERYIRSQALFHSHVARASGICRQRLRLWCAGKSSPMLTSIRKLVRGVRQITDDPDVTANDLFPLDDDE